MLRICSNQTPAAVLPALCSGLIGRSVKGGLILVGAVNLGGAVEMIPNPVAVAELAVEKGAATLLTPISARRQAVSIGTRALASTSQARR